MRVRRLIRVLHRDFGYFLTGLVVFYCISGVAVNHIDDWNPRYSISIEELRLGPLTGATLDELERELVAKADLDPDDVAGRHRPAPGVLIVFLPNGGEAKVQTATGEGTLKRVKTRPVIFESNVLHLNDLKGVWTYVADAFAVLLLGMAITGLFILKGQNGLGGRGKWFFSAGMVVPIAFIYYYYATR